MFLLWHYSLASFLIFSVAGQKNNLLANDPGHTEPQLDVGIFTTYYFTVGLCPTPKY